MKLDFIFTYLLPPHLQTPQPPGDPLALVPGSRPGATGEPLPEPGPVRASLPPPARALRLWKLEGKARSKQPF